MWGLIKDIVKTLLVSLFSIAKIIMMIFMFIIVFVHFNSYPPFLFLLVTVWCVLFFGGFYAAAKRSEGVSLIKRGRYVEALYSFTDFHRFLTLNSWLDAFQYFTQIWSSKTSYRAAALIGLTFCYERMGDFEQAGLCFDSAVGRFIDAKSAEAFLTRLRLNDKPFVQLQQPNNIPRMLPGEVFLKPALREVYGASFWIRLAFYAHALLFISVFLTARNDNFTPNVMFAIATAFTLTAVVSIVIKRLKGKYAAFIDNCVAVTVFLCFDSFVVFLMLRTFLKKL